jgi:sulfatase modifying factor 1
MAVDHPLISSGKGVLWIVLEISLLITISFTLTGCDAILPPDCLAHIRMRDMITVPGGTYTQSDGTDSFTHNVSTFMLAEYEVTYELWYVVYQWAVAHGYRFDYCGREGSNGINGAPPTSAKYEPVTMISWKDAIVWCNAYSEVDYLTPCYRQSGDVIRDSHDVAVDIVCDWGVNGFRLPSEGEWQFAAGDRGAASWNYAAGASTYQNDVSDSNPTDGIPDGKEADDLVAIYGFYWDGTPGPPPGVIKTATVGTKKANGLGLFDLSGNVAEFCWDSLSGYPTTTQTDYHGGELLMNQILRGGSWNDRADSIQIGYRRTTKLGVGELYFGFRVARS